jgi:VIT1/CCC1 family predicted Fe2+/Mn2+ transporter
LAALGVASARLARLARVSAIKRALRMVLLGGLAIVIGVAVATSLGGS